MAYAPSADRYEQLPYRRCGNSGLILPVISFGLWHTFGDRHDTALQRDLICRAFDRGVTHFDLANNYGPPPGRAEERFGELLASELKDHRDELVISTKAGYRMWPGPYGDGGSRKYLLDSLDQSLRRLAIDHVDIFYSHRFDPGTSLHETCGALDHAVRSGKARYVGISSYSGRRTEEAIEILGELGTPLLIHQPSYSLVNRWVEEDLLDVLGREQIGCIAFSPLAQGILTGKYLGGSVPDDSRAASSEFLDERTITPELLARVGALAEIASSRGQSLAQMAIAWVLRDERVTSALIGASSVAQLDENLDAAAALDFNDDELEQIDKHARESGINLWKTSSDG